MMKATEARALRDAALKSQEGEVGQRLGLLYKQIETEAKSGKACTDADAIMKGLNTDQRRAFTGRLRADGYTVKEGSDLREGSWCIVGWEMVGPTT